MTLRLSAGRWRICRKRFLAGVASLIACVAVGCAALPPPARTIPPCPMPGRMVELEVFRGALDDAPHTEFYLGRVENYCDAIEELR